MSRISDHMLATKNVRTEQASNVSFHDTLPYLQFEPQAMLQRFALSFHLLFHQVADDPWTGFESRDEISNMPGISVQLSPTMN